MYAPSWANAVGTDHDDFAPARYVLAYTLREPPTKTVAETFGLTYATAAKWVQRARRKELLGKAEPGKAGV